MGSLVYLDSKAHVLSSTPPHRAMTPTVWREIQSDGISYPKLQICQVLSQASTTQAGDSTCFSVSFSNVWGAVFGGRAAGIPGTLPQTRLSQAPGGSKHHSFVSNLMKRRVQGAQSHGNVELVSGGWKMQSV